MTSIFTRVFVKPFAADQVSDIGILFRSRGLPVLVHHVRDGLPEIIEAPGYFHLAPVRSRRPSPADSDLKSLYLGVRCVGLPSNPASSTAFYIQLYTACVLISLDRAKERNSARRQCLQPTNAER